MGMEDRTIEKDIRKETTFMINFTCHNCGHYLNIPDQYANTTGKCRHCNHEIEVPDLTWTAKFDVFRKNIGRIGCGGLILIFSIFVTTCIMVDVNNTSQIGQPPTSTTPAPIPAELPKKIVKPPSMIDDMSSKPKHTKSVTPQYEPSKRNNSSFNPQSYVNKLKKGMTYNQVVRIMGVHGKKGMEMNWGDGDIHRTMNWEWTGNMFRGESSGFISIQFVNDRVDGWTFFSL